MPPTQIGLIGDIHTQSRSLRATLQVFQDQKIQSILCTGDIVDGGGDVDECCRILREHSVQVVRGNHDHWFIQNQLRDLPDATLPEQVSPATLEYLRSLPDQLEIETPQGGALLCHGIGSNNMARLYPDDKGYALESNIDLHNILGSRRYPFLINGHTHRKMIRKFGACVIINAGTLAPWHDPCFLSIDFEKGAVQFYMILKEEEILKGPEIALSSIKTEFLI